MFFCSVIQDTFQNIKQESKKLLIHILVFESR